MIASKITLRKALRGYKQFTAIVSGDSVRRYSSTTIGDIDGELEGENRDLVGEGVGEVPQDNQGPIDLLES